MLEDLSMPMNIALFAGAAAVVWIAGTRLAHVADAIATVTGLGREFLGLILLGGVTSSPEIAIAISASLEGAPVLTINDVLGSAASNVVILAVADAIIGRDALTSVQGSSQVLLQGVFGMLLMAIAVGATVAGDVLVLGIGGFSWLLLATYVLAIWVLSRARTESAWKVASSGAEQNAGARSEDGRESGQHSLKRLIVETVLIAAAILLAGYVLTKSAAELAHQTGLGAGYFAVVFLAITTSLPEVSTVIGAVRLRRYEMAISDIFGTNLVNVTIIGLVDALHDGGPVLLEVGRSSSISALLALLLTGTFLVGMLERRNRAVFRMGPDSIAALLMYAAGLTLLYFKR